MDYFGEPSHEFFPPQPPPSTSPARRTATVESIRSEGSTLGRSPPRSALKQNLVVDSDRKATVIFIGIPNADSESKGISLPSMFPYNIRKRMKRKRGRGRTF
jgi:hypothetical protein